MERGREEEKEGGVRTECDKQVLKDRREGYYLWREGLTNISSKLRNNIINSHISQLPES